MNLAPNFFLKKITPAKQITPPNKNQTSQSKYSGGRKEAIPIPAIKLKQKNKNCLDRGR